MGWAYVLSFMSLVLSSAPSMTDSASNKTIIMAGGGTGGHLYPGIAVAESLRQKTPTVLINPDVIPGKANQYLMKHSAAVCCQFEETREHVSASRRAKLKITGCPIRSDFASLPDRAAATGRLGLDPSLKTLTIT